MPRTFVWHPRRGPKRTESLDTLLGPVGDKQIRIEQVRSGIGRSWRMRRTLEAIGLKHHQDVVIKQDSPSLRGQIERVRHLVSVTSVEE